jgi:hypothetical protein
MTKAMRKTIVLIIIILIFSLPTKFLFTGYEIFIDSQTWIECFKGSVMLILSYYGLCCVLTSINDFKEWIEEWTDL